MKKLPQQLCMWHVFEKCCDEYLNDKYNHTHDEQVRYVDFLISCATERGTIFKYSSDSITLYSHLEYAARDHFEFNLGEMYPKLAGVNNGESTT